MADESQKSPNPSPVSDSLAVKAPFPHANLHITEKITARPTPAMAAETCVSSWLISGPVFFSARIDLLSSWSRITVRRLSQA